VLVALGAGAYVATNEPAREQLLELIGQGKSGPEPAS
jgi:hypothetical protein